MTGDALPLGASFRDPSGFLYRRDGILYRQINQSYRQDYDSLMTSGLYELLVHDGLLVAHEEDTSPPADPGTAYKVIRPENIPFISYPYEWSFSQVKSAALATLAVQRHALRRGMCLKDASAFNMQFLNGRATLIDSLSFERHQEGRPWVAYRQFCQHFLAPLALMAYRDVRLSQLLRVHIDGIPLDLAARLLPFRARLNPGLFTHIYLHAMVQKRFAGSSASRIDRGSRMSKAALEGLLENLRSLVRGLSWSASGTEWGSYYEESAAHYSENALRHKQAVVAGFIDRISPRNVWDLGANTGRFSRIASGRGIFTVAFDVDPAAVEKNYLACKAAKETNLLPLVLDLANPTPAIGWNNAERMSLIERGPADLALALALSHHLAIVNNVPLPRLATFLRSVSRWLIIEFVPKQDSQVQILLSSRDDIFPDYTVGGFEKSFMDSFEIREAVPIQGTQRMVYLMEGR
jgi:hypothetical protein